MKSTLMLFFIFLASPLVAQDWYKQIVNQAKLVGSIRSMESWETIYKLAKNDQNILKESLVDISKTIEFLNEKRDETVVDQFFRNICDSIYTEFPYRRSGYLTNDLYTLPKGELSEIDIIIASIVGKSLYRDFATLIQIDRDILLPLLQKYLENDAWTRLCIRPDDWSDVPYCLSMSDVALEIIELKTYCDFFDNASHEQMLFSNIDTITRNRIIRNITDWYRETIFLTNTESIVYFLDRFTDLGHSYTYTCNNLMFLGDSTLARIKLKERKTLLNCSTKLSNYALATDEYDDCIRLVLERENSLYKESNLSVSLYHDLREHPVAKGTSQYVFWHKLFSLIAMYDKSDIPKILVLLMKNEQIVIDAAIVGKETWEIKYPAQYYNKFRVCDFALLKFNELIRPLNIKDWYDVQEKDEMIDKLIEEYTD